MGTALVPAILHVDPITALTCRARTVNFRLRYIYPMKRRQFLKTAAVAGAASSIFNFNSFAQSRDPKRKMTLNLVCGAIGVQADQMRAIELASKYGFESVEAKADYLASLSSGEMDSLKRLLRDRKLVWGTSGLSVDFRGDERKFKEGLKQLPKQAKGLRKAGVERVSTWLRPASHDLTYNKNFKQHADRLRQVCRILKDNDIRFGMEYVGTTTLLISRKYPFIHTMAEALELVDAIGTGNAGIVLDSWHWWQAGDSVADIEKLRNQDIILVDLNDAPKDIDKQRQLDGQRQLPMATGVIDTNGFVNALVKIGYDGPVRAEPFNQTLRDLDDASACKATVDSLRKAMKLIS